MRVGLSFGKCVRDIILGDVAIDDVLFIVAQTRVEDLSGLLEISRTHYASDPKRFLGLDPDTVAGVISTLWSRGKIHQPRLFNDSWSAMAYAVVAQHHWMALSPMETNMKDNPVLEEAWNNYQVLLKLSAE